jgi:site-specific DNA recombinase
VISGSFGAGIQTKLAANTVERRSGGTARSPSLFAGLLFDSEGHRMTPSHAVKRGKGYRYYISRPLISTGRGTAPEALRIPAGEIEQLVVARLGPALLRAGPSSRSGMAEVETAVQQRHLQQRAAARAANWHELTVTQRRLMLTAFIKRIVVGIDRVDIQLSPSRFIAVLRHVTPGPIPMDFTDQPDQPILLSIPAQFRRAGLGIRMLTDEAGSPMRAAKADPKVIKLIARAHLFSHRLAESSGEHLYQIAKGLGVTRSYLTRVLRLTYLAPDITRAILEGRHAGDLTAQRLLFHSRLPLSWPEQRQILGFA